MRAHVRECGGRGGRLCRSACVCVNTRVHVCVHTRVCELTRERGRGAGVLQAGGGRGDRAPHRRLRPS
eukprot:2018891-Rhodomonas_salina.1